VTAKVVGSGALFGVWSKPDTLETKNADSLRNTGGIILFRVNLAYVRSGPRGKSFTNAANTCSAQHAKRFLLGAAETSNLQLTSSVAREAGTPFRAEKQH
jgi:hypothetical protein